MIVKAKKLGKLTLSEAKKRLAQHATDTQTCCWLLRINRRTAEYQTFYYYKSDLPF